MIPLLPLFFAAGAAVIIKKNADEKAAKATGSILPPRRHAGDNECEKYNNLKINASEIHDRIESSRFRATRGESLAYAKSVLGTYVPERCIENPGVRIRFVALDGTESRMPLPTAAAVIAGALILKYYDDKESEMRLVDAWHERVDPRTASQFKSIDRTMTRLGYMPTRGMPQGIMEFQSEWNFFVTEMMAPTQGYEILDVDGLPGPKTKASMELALRTPDSMILDGWEVDVKNFSHMIELFEASGQYFDQRQARL